MDTRTQEYILKRLERLEKLVDPVSKFEIETDMDKKGKFRVEVMIETPHHLYRAEDTTDSIEASIDMVVDELETQVIRHKEKMHDLKKEGAREFKDHLLSSGDMDMSEEV